jgi:hypothetical protein
LTQEVLFDGVKLMHTGKIYEQINIRKQRFSYELTQVLDFIDPTG